MVATVDGERLTVWYQLVASMLLSSAQQAWYQRNNRYKILKTGPQISWFNFIPSVFPSFRDNWSRWLLLTSLHNGIEEWMQANISPGKNP